MNKKLQIEMLYDSKKKSMIIAYLLGFLLGSFGVHYFYAGETEMGVFVIALLVAGMLFPPVLFIFWAVVIIGVVHTYFVVEDANKKIHLQCEALYED